VQQLIFTPTVLNILGSLFVDSCVKDSLHSFLHGFQIVDIPAYE